MKPIDVKEQPILSAGRVFQIALSGVKYRLFRAAVTVAVITVAMAFLMNILTESLIKRAVADSVREQIEDLRTVDAWIAKLSIPQTTEEILEQIASVSQSELDLHELVHMSGKPSEALLAAEPVARDALFYLRFFNDMNFGRRRVLVGSAEATRIFDHLQTPAAWQTFTANLADMHTIRFPAAVEDFEAFLAAWPDLRSLVASVRDGQARAIRHVQRNLGDTPLAQALRAADGPFGEVLREAGFALSERQAATLSTEVERLEAIQRIEGTINNPGIRQAVAADRDVLPGDVSMQLIWGLLRQRDRSEWFYDLMAEHGLNVDQLSPQRIEELAAHQGHVRLLKIAERQTTGAGGGFMDIGPRMTWLAMVSMLVCAVGITNAMLMSVTERFREIATLKCLGALDGFIMVVFLIEAGILGIVGGIGGAIIGLLLGFVRMLFTFQSLAFNAFPLTQLLYAGLISIGLGMILAAVAAVYPSMRAARLAPMEAMRIE
ncbi:MAG TPA: hypothetical protein PKE55_00695 [Kiritimatiellia bacterium]|nr:hypothetical protein [Kiritimatiellia bacterium]